MTSQSPQSSYVLLYEQIRIRYMALHKHIRARSVLGLRRGLRYSGFPSSRGCDTIREVLECFQKEEDSNENCLFEEKRFGVALYAFCLAQMTLLNEILQSRDIVPQHKGNECNNKNTGIDNDLMTEFCRPIVDRVRYHFLQPSTSSHQSTSSTSDSSSVRTTSSRVDRLPEWLFTYLREIIVDNGSYDIVKDNLSYIICHASKRVHVEIGKVESPTSAVISNHNLAENRRSTFHTNKSLKSSTMHVLNQIGSCKEETCHTFLTEMFKLSQHVLQMKKIFRHPAIVRKSVHIESSPKEIIHDTLTNGHKATNRDAMTPLPLCRAIEQLLRFDELLHCLLSQCAETKKCLNLPRLIDSFIASDTILFTWWMQVEKVHAIYSLRDIAFNTNNNNKILEISKESVMGTLSMHGSILPISSVSEGFICILHSVLSKTNAIADHIHRREFRANVAVPLCIEYTETVHEKATSLRAALVKKHTIGGSGALSIGTSVLPTNDYLSQNINGWIDNVTGTHFAMKYLNTKSSSSGVKDTNISLCKEESAFPRKEMKESNDLKRIGNSLQKMRDAMVQEFINAFVETLLMERAKLASYLMRCAYILSCPEPANLSSFENNENFGIGIDSHYTPELNDAIDMLSIVIKTCCHRASNELLCDNKQFQSYSAPQIMMEGIAGSINEMIIEIALDIHGTVPEICLEGAVIFRSDVLALLHPFSQGEGKRASIIFSRLLDIINLMAMESKKYTTLRYALKDLAYQFQSQHMPTTTFGDKDYDSNFCIQLSMFESDDRLLDEALSMLMASGYLHLKLSDAICIMNRRKS